MKKVAKIKTVTIPKLYIPKKDPSQEWFVSFSYLHPETGKFKRFRVYEGFYQCISTMRKDSPMGSALRRC